MLDTGASSAWPIEKPWELRVLVLTRTDRVLETVLHHALLAVTLYPVNKDYHLPGGVHTGGDNGKLYQVLEWASPDH